MPHTGRPAKHVPFTVFVIVFKDLLGHGVEVSLFNLPPRWLMSQRDSLSCVCTFFFYDGRPVADGQTDCERELRLHRVAGNKNRVLRVQPESCPHAYLPESFCRS